MNSKRVLISLMGAALIGGAVAGVGLTAFAASDTTTAPAQQAAHKAMAMRGGPGVMGTVSAISGSTLTVAGENGGVYTIDASGASVEKYANGTSSSVTIANIAVGDTVMIDGQIQTATLTAKDIHDGMPPKPAMPAAVGKVTAVSGSSITLSGFGKPTTAGTKPAAVTYTVDASSATITKVSAPAAKGDKPTTSTIAVSGISVGDMLTVQGTANGSVVTATTIADGAGFGMRGGFDRGEKQGS